MTRSPAERRAAPRTAAGALLALAVAVAPAAGAGADPAVAEPDGYRMEAYRAPVPDTLAGATVLDTAALEALIAGDRAVLVDVMPRPPRPAGLAPGTIWRAPPRRDIPGSHWLPNTGFGALAEDTERYLRDGLDRLTGGDRSRPLVFYCLADCWMSWNAARRALSYGYRAVYWYPEGTDGWNGPLVAAEPEAPR